MELQRVIDELRQAGLTEPVPPDHPTRRREDRWLAVDDGESAPVTTLEASPTDTGAGGEQSVVRDEADDGLEAAEERVEDEAPNGASGLPDEFIVGIDPDIDLTSLPDYPELEQDARDEGIDALAWYRSFHWEPSDLWGIYIRETAVFSLATTVFSDLKFKRLQGRPVTSLDRVRQAFRLLFLHEYFHFVTDVGATLLELGQSRPGPKYSPYVKAVYLRPTNQAEPLEEALANAYAYERLPGTRYRTKLRRFFLSQPAGYKAFQQVLGSGFVQGRRALASAVAQGATGASRVPLEMLIDPDSAAIGYRDVPVHIVKDHSDPAVGLWFVTAIPIADQIESAQFVKDLGKLPSDLRKRWETKTRRMMAENLRAGGLNFEALRACDTVFSVRVNQGYRATLRQAGAKWELLRIGKHDDVYRRPGGC